MFWALVSMGCPGVKNENKNEIRKNDFF